jgi:pimeloyl-ACP methyl ester carboxylesterase
MGYTEQMIDAPDARILEVATFGDPEARTVFFHHGSPGATSTVKFMTPLVEDAGLCFVTMSRAGYGNSSRREGRNVASVVDDVRTVLDALGRDRYVSLGWSGGGAHALACAALDAPRCMAAATLAGVAPTDVDFDWTEGMGPENVEEFALAREGGPAYEAHVAKAGELFGAATADNVVELHGGLLSGADKDVLADDATRAMFAQSNRDAFALGYAGYYDDDRAFFSSWGFHPATIEVPVDVWYGDEDLMVPPTHGAWLGRNISTSVLHHHPVEGHLSIFANHMKELAAALARPFA